MHFIRLHDGHLKGRPLLLQIPPRRRDTARYDVRPILDNWSWTTSRNWSNSHWRLLRRRRPNIGKFSSLSLLLHRSFSSTRFSSSHLKLKKFQDEEIFCFKKIIYRLSTDGSWTANSSRLPKIILCLLSSELCRNAVIAHQKLALYPHKTPPSCNTEFLNTTRASLFAFVT